MKNSFFFFVVVAIISGLNGCKNHGNHNHADSNLSVTVDSFLASPDTWAGKEIVLTGTVSHVCKHSGKKLFLFGSNPEKTIKVNAGENIPTFDIKFEGSDIEIAGVVVEDDKIDATYLNEWEAEIKESIGDKDQKVCNAESSAIAGQANPDSTVAAADPYAKVKEFRAKLEKSGKPYIPIYAIDVISLKEIKKEPIATN